MVLASLLGSFICSKESKLFQIGPRILLEEKLAKHNELATVPLNRLQLRKRSYCCGHGRGQGQGQGRVRERFINLLRDRAESCELRLDPLLVRDLCAIKFPLLHHLDVR